jgi:hypothetical protein
MSALIKFPSRPFFCRAMRGKAFAETPTALRDLGVKTISKNHSALVATGSISEKSNALGLLV